MLQYKQIMLCDIDQLTELYVDTFNSPPWNDQWTKETAGRRLHQLICVEDFYGLCVYQEEELCGMILGGKEQFYDGMMFHIKEFCVKNVCRGQGIGAQILDEFVKRLKEQEIQEIMLMTSHNDKTEGFYQKHGLSTYSGLVIMGKKL